MWPFTPSKKAIERTNRDENRNRKIISSQLALIEAATMTADVAHNVTNKLRQNLEDSVRQFETTARLISDALIICDELGQIKAFNPAAEKIFATTFDKMDKKCINKLFLFDNKTPENITDLAKHIEDCADEGEMPKLTGLRSTGECFTIDATMARLDRQDGSTVILFLIRDLTSEAENSKIAEIHSQRFQSLFNLSFDGILIIQNSKVVAANRPASVLFGIEPDALLDTLSTLLMNPTDFNQAPVEIAAKRGDGSNVPLLFSSTGITWNNQPAHLITVKDMSEMRQLKHEFYRTGYGKDMICVFDKNFKIKFANLFFIDYYKCVKVVGKDIRDLLPTSDRDTFSLKLLSLTPTNDTVRSQVQHIRDDQQSRLLDWTDHAVFGPDGTIIEYQRTGRDITNVLNNLMTK